MLPKHGKIECRACFPEESSDVFEPNKKWRMVNDPGAWGGNNNPEYLVLGFSKGFTQAGMFGENKFEDIAFAGMRNRLTKALQSISILPDSEHISDNINDPNSKIAFGSLIRCSVSRVDDKKLSELNQSRYSCTGPLITKSFAEIPEIINKCSSKYLVGLPDSIKAVIFLSNSDKYVVSVQGVIENLFPKTFKRLNPMCVEADGRKWVHIAHVSGLNGHFNTWLKSDSGPGRKRVLAIDGLKLSKAQNSGDNTVYSSKGSLNLEKLIEEINEPKITEIYAIGTRGDAAGKKFIAKRDKNGKFVLNKKKASTSSSSTNMAVNKVHVDTLNEAFELLTSEQYLINLICSSGSRALRRLNAVKIVRS
jgi:hypothetical protein